jgi:hypothetical protein
VVCSGCPSAKKETKAKATSQTAMIILYPYPPCLLRFIASVEGLELTNVSCDLFNPIFELHLLRYLRFYDAAVPIHGCITMGAKIVRYLRQRSITRHSGIQGSGSGVVTVPRQGSSSLMVVSRLMKFSVISVSGRPTPRKSIPRLFRPESAPLQSGMIFRPRVCWESNGLLRGSDTW